MTEPAPTRFLLYIDILGFSEMTKSDPRSVARTYAILNKLNVHRDKAFKTIVFSDTVLVYNPIGARNDEDRNFYVWYLAEAAEDLYSRLVGQDIWFRAVLIAGEFNHYQLENLDAFYGKALIDAYQSEKRLPLIGLALHSSCLPYNRFFRVSPFTDDFSFVYLSRPLEYLHAASGDGYPFANRIVSDHSPALPEGVRYLSDIYRLMRTHPEPLVRAKALTTWDFHARRYPGMVAALVANNFSLDALAPPGTWDIAVKTLEENIRHNKRAGAGSQMSVSITPQRPRKPGKAIF
ncbi:hypothetical protein [Sphingopyxis alaskensis]|uniref:Uncharacterized protein n=1 Tax=Sphingopyxis alaskensis (strain DSM 13593 / LMG 18877 / RB2256) TaxID=317655 RepID=Q1GX38_SPHAL|nr:hypothetical protein [Sphingopyxis alaskensis]ABF51784.1 conserved hypothetical protein [Sphingopyxis alaskensis RB2256]